MEAGGAAAERKQQLYGGHRSSPKRVADRHRPFRGWGPAGRGPPSACRHCTRKPIEPNRSAICSQTVCVLPLWSRMCRGQRPTAQAVPAVLSQPRLLGLSPSISPRSNRLELGFPAGRYTRARKARRWSQALATWEMSVRQTFPVPPAPARRRAGVGSSRRPGRCRSSRARRRRPAARPNWSW